MKFYKGIKYQVAETFSLQTYVLGHDIEHDLVSLTSDGKLTMKKWFGWDGASGAFDTDTIMVPSCGHDALYMLIRQGLLPESCKELADLSMRKWEKDRGMWECRQNWIMKALEKFGKSAIEWRNRRKIHEVQ